MFRTAIITFLCVTFAVIAHAQANKTAEEGAGLSKPWERYQKLERHLELTDPAAQRVTLALLEQLAWAIAGEKSSDLNSQLLLTFNVEEFAGELQKFSPEVAKDLGGALVNATPYSGMEQHVSEMTPATQSAALELAEELVRLIAGEQKASFNSRALLALGGTERFAVRLQRLSPAVGKQLQQGQLRQRLNDASGSNPTVWIVGLLGICIFTIALGAAYFFHRPLETFLERHLRPGNTKSVV